MVVETNISASEVKSIVATWTKAVRDDNPPLILSNPKLIKTMTPLLNKNLDFRDALLAAACSNLPVEDIQNYAVGTQGSYKRDVMVDLFNGSIGTDKYADNATIICWGLRNRLKNSVDKSMPMAVAAFCCWYTGLNDLAFENASASLRFNPENSLSKIVIKAHQDLSPYVLLQNSRAQKMDAQSKPSPKPHQAR